MVPENPPSVAAMPFLGTQPSFLQKWGGLVVLSLALAIVVIDTTLLNVSLATIIKDLHTNLLSLQWVISAYSLVLAALTITGGRLGDLYGRKKMFLVGAVLFAIGSFMASISQNFASLLIGESLIEGVGAALMMPATSSLLVATYRGKDRAVAFGVWGGIAAASSAIGPILGGWLTSHYSWRWGFRINIGVTAILLLSSFLIKESHERAKNLTLDLLGVFLSAIGLLGVVFGIIESSTYGWLKAKLPFDINLGSDGSLINVHERLTFGSYGFSIAILSMALGIIFLVAFMFWQNYRESRNLTPLVSMKLFSNRQFSSGMITTAVLSLGMSGLIFAIPVFLQSVRGLDALHTGFALLPLSIALLIGAPLSANLVQRMSAKTLVQFGLTLTIVGSLLNWHTISVGSTALSFAPGLLIYGFGMGLMIAQISNLTLSAVSVEQAGEASGLNNTMRQLGSTMGSAIVGAVLLSAVTTGIATRVDASPVIPAPVKTVIQSSLASQAGNAEFGGISVPQGTDPSIAAEMTRIVHESTVDGNKKALVYTALFGFLGFLVSFLLPKKADLGHGATSGDRPAPAGH